MHNNVTHCKGTTASGEVCKLKPGPSGYCHVHDPESKRQAEEAERRIQQEQEALIQHCQKQLEQVRQVISNLESERILIQEHRTKHQLLASVTEGLYIEIEKLTKKAPAEQITKLALEQVNDVIKDTKELVKDDSYIQKLKVFVPAGDLPELRDTLIVLRQIKQGLERFAGTLNTNVNTQITNAKHLESELVNALSRHDYTSLERLKSKGDILGGINIPDMSNLDVGNGQKFDFGLLDKIEI